MTPAIALLALFFAAAVVLFAREVVPADVAALCLLVGLVATRLLSPAEALAGFGSEVLVLLAALFVVSEALVSTGALTSLERLLLARAERSPRLALLFTLAATAAVSAFLSNTATMAAFLPLALALARRLQSSASPLLMPVAFASIVGGSCTLIGTSTNVVVSGLLAEAGEPPLGFFELTRVGLVLVAVALPYLALASRRLLPAGGGEPLVDRYALRAYLSEVVVPDGSRWIGRTLAELALGESRDVTVLGWSEPREGPAAPRRLLAAGDVLTVEASPAALLALRQSRDVDLLTDRKFGEGGSAVALHELLLAPRSRLSGTTLKEAGFRTVFGLTALAIYRRGEALRDRVGRATLRDGDILLVEGDLAGIEELLRDGDLIPLERFALRPARGRAGLALAVFAGMVVAGATGLVPLPFAALAAATAVVLGRCLAPADAYAAIDWRALVMIGALFGFGQALQSTGAAELLGRAIVALGQEQGPFALLAAFYLLTVFLTQPMSNQAAAIVVFPLVLDVAARLALDPRPFAVTVCLAASCSFLTPFEPASLLVYGPGRYRFRDYFRFGLPLTALSLAVTLWLVPRLWPFVARP